MKKIALMLAACAAPFLACAPAGAAIVTLTYDLTATNWAVNWANANAPAADPVDPLHLNFTLTFDTATSTNGATTDGLVVNAFNLPFALNYSYDADFGDLWVGTETYGSSAFNYGCTTFRFDAGTFCVAIAEAGSSAATLAYDDWSGTYWLSQGSPGRQWDAREASLTVAAPGAVPEPASWAMMIAGLGFAGASLRRRQQQRVFAAA